MLLNQDNNYKRKLCSYRSSFFILFIVSDRVPLSLGIKSPEKSHERLRVKNNPTCGLLKLLFSIWKEDFGTCVPVQLIFSKKNMGYLAEAKQREVKLIPMCGAGWHSCRNSASLQCSLVAAEASGVWLLLAGLVSAGQ